MLTAQQRYRQSEQGKATNRARALRLFRARREWLNSLKVGPCVDCGREYPPYVLDFDHRDQSQKHLPVSKMLMYSKERILAEIEKCDLVCANCHRERTHAQGH